MAETTNLQNERDEMEAMLSCMIERQNSSPSEKNLQSMLNALKECGVYIPVKFVMTKEQQKKFAEAQKTGRPMLAADDMRVSPQLLISKDGEKIMPWFSRQSEIIPRQGDGVTFIKIPAEKAAELADNMPDAFDIVFDLYTHPVKLTIDELLDGISGNIVGAGEDNADEEDDE